MIVHFIERTSELERKMAAKAKERKKERKKRYGLGDGVCAVWTFIHHLLLTWTNGRTDRQTDRQTDT